MNNPGWYTDDKYWWYTTGLLGNQTRSWVNGQNWMNFARYESKRATALTSLGSPVVGDIVQIKWAGKSSISHSMVVTKRDSKGNIYVSYHSKDTLDKALAAIVSDPKNKGATYYAHRI